MTVKQMLDGVFMMTGAVVLLYLAGYVMDRFELDGQSPWRGVPNVLASGVLLLGLIGLISCSWSRDLQSTARWARHLVVTLIGFLMLGGGWMCALAPALICVALVWRSSPAQSASSSEPS